MKKKLLIVTHHLTIGGVQKSLLSTLKAIDYSKFDVTLYLRKNRTALLSFIDKRVNVIVNDDPNHYYRKPLAVIYQIAIVFFTFLKKSDKINEYKDKLNNLIVNYSMNYEYNHFFKNKTYDIAISYVQGYEALFVSKYIDATKKLVYYHTSTDDLHSLHSEILPKFTKIIALHDSQKELLSKWYPDCAEKIFIIGNYVDTDNLKKQCNEYKIPVNDSRTILCSCGRFSYVKGFDLAVKAAKLLKDNNINFVWYFVGDGPERENIIKLIKDYNLENQIIITGMKQNPYPYIGACDIYVQPSYEEAQPLTIIEAHKLCKPVISTETLGGKKLIYDGVNGLLSTIDEKTLSSKITELILDKELYNSIVTNLCNIDYSEEFNEFKSELNMILEE